MVKIYFGMLYCIVIHQALEFSHRGSGSSSCKITEFFYLGHADTVYGPISDLEGTSWYFGCRDIVRGKSMNI